MCSSSLARGKDYRHPSITWHDAPLSRQNSIRTELSRTFRLCLQSTLPLAAMSSADDYDKLTPEEREVRDKADRAREAAEQAGAVL